MFDDVQEILDIGIGQQLCISRKFRILCVAPICLYETFVERGKAIIIAERMAKKNETIL